MSNPQPTDPRERFELTLNAGMIYAVEHAYIDGRVKDDLLLGSQTKAILAAATAYADAYAATYAEGKVREALIQEHKELAAIAKKALKASPAIALAAFATEVNEI